MQRKRISDETVGHSAGLCSEHHRRRQTAHPRAHPRAPASLCSGEAPVIRAWLGAPTPSRPAGLNPGFLEFLGFVFFALNGQVLSQKSSEWVKFQERKEFLSQLLFSGQYTGLAAFYGSVTNYETRNVPSNVFVRSNALRAFRGSPTPDPVAAQNPASAERSAKLRR